MRKICALLAFASVFISIESLSFFNKLSPSTEHPTEEPPTCINDDVDEYLDRILEQARAQIPDPLHLPPRNSYVELSEGRAWGLSTLFRTGAAKVRCLDNDTVEIECKLGVEEMKGRYTWEKTIARSRREGYVVIICDDFEATATIHVPINTNNTNIAYSTDSPVEDHPHPTLVDFDIVKFKKVRIEMTGMGFLTWSLAKLTTWFSGIFQRSLSSAIEGPLKEALEREMMEITLS